MYSFWIILCCIFSTHALKPIFPNYRNGETRWRCGFSTPDSDKCCKFASQQEFIYVSRLEDIPSESHDCEPTRYARGSQQDSEIGMVTSCHDMRDDPLPSGSPRVLNVKVAMSCQHGWVNHFDKDAKLEVAFTDPVTGIHHSGTTTKGSCKPNPTRRATILNAKKARKEQLKEAGLMVSKFEKSERGESSSKRRKRDRVMCHDVGAPTYSEATQNMLAHFEAIAAAANILATIHPPPEPVRGGRVNYIDQEFDLNLPYDPKGE